MRILRITIIFYYIASLVDSFEMYRKDKSEFENKYCKLTFSKEKDTNKSFKKLKKFMQKEKPYLDCDLNIETIAQNLNLSSDYLSQLINKKSGSNFYDFINLYRLKELKKRLTKNENKNTTIISLAYESGFKSKSSFYNTFKELTGITPSQYLGTAA